MTFPPEVWDGVLRRLQESLAPVSYEMWIPQIIAKPVDGSSGVSAQGAYLELICPTQFHCDRVRDYFLTIIGDSVEAEVGQRVPLKVKMAAPRAGGDATSSSVEPPQSPQLEIAATSPPRIHTPADSNKRSTRYAARSPGRRSRSTQAIGQAIGSAIAKVDVADPGAHSSCAAPGSQPAPARIAASAARGRKTLEPTTPSRQPAFPLTFESFTVGSCNALAREAAFALAGQQQLSLNQLFIVADSGLGKTHLSRAVISTAARAIGERARYSTAEAFTSEFTHAVRGNQMSKFKRRYRTNCDLLVFEDVQFLEGKAATQLEFFHTVQHVLDCGGRVLLTGDKFPQELSHLDERVRTRISSGFVAHVEPPDAIVRRNILRAKAAHGGIRLPDDCADLLVERIEGNVRELEGALIQLVTIASLFKRSIDLELTEESLQGRSRGTASVALHTTPSDIIESVAGFFQTSPASLASRSRRRDVLLPRQLAMYLCRRYSDASLADIGRLLNRDHPSVANAVRKIERQLLENVRMRYQVEALIRHLDELGYKPLHTHD